jgi:hypothetical protein
MGQPARRTLGRRFRHLSLDISSLRGPLKIDGGRVYVATPDRLGEYILVDYVANKKKWIA